MATAAGPKYWLLNYTYVPDILEKRGPYREAHLAGAKKHLDAGRLVAAGAVGDPVEGATFFFKDISKVCMPCAACIFVAVAVSSMSYDAAAFCFREIRASGVV
jgi:hypothetical protein